jgi:pSer/pThr/pTyr-binding forkhead associated (FHA) protein/tetratricopeptide (TPR) repeat protein
MSVAPILTIMKEGETIKTCPVDGEVVLGRSEDCTIWLNDRAISRHHAVFRFVGNSIQVEKKSEFAPLTVNGAECTRAVLKEGDIVSVGPYLIRLSAPPQPEADVSERPLAPEPSSPAPSLENDIAVMPAEAGLSVEPLEVPAFEEQPAPMELGLSDQPNSGSDSPGLSVGLDSPSPEDSPQPEAEPEFQMGIENPLVDQLPEEIPVSLDDQPSMAIDEDAKTKIVSETKIAVRLIFKAGTANVTEYELTQDEVTIGRGKDCDIVLNDKKASRKNSIIRRVGLSFIIKDLTSANGTFVNGARVQEKELSGDDLIKIGNVEFTFKATSVDYAAKEKDFMSLPLEEDVPELPLDAGGLDLGQNGALVAPSGNGNNAALQIDPASAMAALGQLPNGGDLGAVPGITGINGASSKKKTLLEKFRALPKRTQLIAGVAGFLFLMWLNEDEEPEAKKPQNGPKKVVAPTGDKGPLTFEALSLEQKRFVEAQHSLAFDYYKNKEYDKSLFEIEKIFAIIPDYKDAREIQRYAREGKRKLEAIEEERRKKEEEELLKKKIAQLVEETRERMKKKNYEQAKELFTQVLSIDPDNAEVTNWRKEIDAYEEQIRLEEQQRQVQKDINLHAWDVFKEAADLKKRGKYHSAISTFQKVLDIGASDPKLLPLTKKMIGICYSTIRRLRDPVLKEAKQQEDSGEFSKAFTLYKKATKIDPPHPTGYAGMNRIRGILHERAKVIYTEAILAESFSDFTTAKKLFNECLQVAPHDDIYYERAQRKLAHYFKKEEAPPQ